ncbi:MAG: PAS domain S-box protein, partial [Dehalococcoidia bacterium]|nr:PAS domain S-box protein [Dehalococcoidia bacterium]
MQDSDRDKEQFIDELGPLRQRIAELEASEAERKKIEEALKRSELRYKELAESITDVFFAMDNKLRYMYWNRASEELTGISAKDALGKRFHDIFPDDEASRRAENAYRKALTTRKPQHFVNNFHIGDRDYVFDISAYPTKGGLCVYVKDVTERTKLEEALKESELWYRHIFDNAPFGIGFSSIDGKVINLNKAMETITGYSAEEFSKVNLADTYVNKADREALLKELSRHGGVTDYPLQLRRKNGTIYDALLSARLTAIGNREFVQTICHDVTERKWAEEALRESEERYRSLVDLSPEAIFVASEGKHVFMNSAGLKLLGASSPDQIIGKPVMDVIHPDYREVVAERMQKSIETGITPPALEEKFLRLDGTEIDVEVRAAPLIYQGKPAMQAVVRDITERKQAEESLRLSEQNFRDSIENSPLGIRIVSEDGEMLYANRALLGIYGYGSLEELKAVPSKKRYTPESYAEHRERVKKRKLGEYVPPNYEIIIVRKDGQVRNLTVSRGEVLWDGEKQFQVVYQDITERKAREQEYQAIIR